MLTETKDILKTLSDTLAKDLVVEEIEEPEYLLRLSSKIAKWQSLYTKKLHMFKSIQLLKDEKYKELYMYYQFEFDVKLDKKELSIFISADTEYRNLQTQSNDLEVQLNFIERAIKTLDSQSWNLKTRLEYMKILGLVNNG